MPQHRMHPAKLLTRWWAILAAVLLILVLGIWLWHYHPIRPYLAAVGTAVAAFLGPLPGLLDPKTREKWLFAIGIAAAIGVGTWYCVEDMQNESKRLVKEKDSLNNRLLLQQQLFKDSVSNLSTEEQSKFLVNAAHHLSKLYPQAEMGPMSDVISVMAQLDHDNGHTLYLAGEEYRSLGKQTEMRGAFQHYLAAAEHHPEALEGDYRSCYQSPSGYCAERTAFINHLMAHDYLHEAMRYEGDRQADALRTALLYERRSLKLWNFNRDGSLESSCELLLRIAEQRRRVGQPTTDVDAVSQEYNARYGLCHPGSTAESK